MSEKIIIRQAEYTEHHRIISYLQINWRANHVFTQSPEFFVWQHADSENLHLLTYVIAEKITAQGSEIIGILGYMPFRRFDINLESNSLSLAIWHVKKDAGTPGLGVQLLNWLKKNKTPDFIAAIGLSKMVIPIYQAFRYTLGKLHQSALFGPSPTNLEIASGVPDDAFRPLPLNPSIELRALKRSDDENKNLHSCINRLGNTVIPVKSWKYLVERFFEHPLYKYNIYAVLEDNEISAILVLRVVQVTLSTGLHRVLRIIDMLGPSEMLAKAAPALQRLIAKHESEYLDVMQSGINPEILRASGFIDSELIPDLVLPNYFEPFEKKNIELKIAFKYIHQEQHRSIRLMRADSDQDRPSQIPIK